MQKKKSLAKLNDYELNVIYECLKAAVYGPFFPDREFHTLFGAERTDLEKLVVNWPDVDEADDVVSVLINNAMNNLLGYPHRREDVWSEFISVSRDGVRQVFLEWRRLRDS